MLVETRHCKAAWTKRDKNYATPFVQTGIDNRSILQQKPAFMAKLVELLALLRPPCMMAAALG